MDQASTPAYFGKFPVSILNPVLLPNVDDKNDSSEAGKSCHHVLLY